ncbi:hypothetical protein MSPP1_000414 [Malassezia sp. CBS 17886]|nr:hypothetical protein MSPP1_000414 [Malassezia sp. CBS 17886]
MPAVTDPGLIPQLVPRVQRIHALLQRVYDAESGAVAAPEGADVLPDAPAAVPDAEVAAPSLALGAIADDDDLDLWTHASESAGVTTRTSPELMAGLARETSELKAELDAAVRAVDDAPGADLSIGEQEAVLRLLTKYAAQQEYVGREAELR